MVNNLVKCRLCPWGAGLFSVNTVAEAIGLCYNDVGVKIPFDPNIILYVKTRRQEKCNLQGEYSMETHNYDMIDFEQVRLELEDKFLLSTNCMKKTAVSPEDIRWTSDDEKVVSVDKKGTVTANGLGTAVVTASLGENKAKCFFKVIEKQFPFKDVTEDDWYYEAVDFVRRSNLMNGQDKKTFGPAGMLTRAQFAMILYRMSGAPKIEYTEKFSDVPKNEWFAKAVLWVDRVGIAGGYSGTDMFGPNDNISREQMAVMMYRYAGYKNYDTGLRADISPYEDASAVSDYAADAMKWAVGSGILTGKNNGAILEPQGLAMRCECAMIIMRFVKKYED